MQFIAHVRQKLIAADGDMPKLFRGCDASPDLFAKAKPLRSGVTLLLARESFWTDKKQKLPGLKEDYEARAGGAPMKSALAWYEALMENGIPADFAEMDAFDWAQESYKGQVAILAHQLAVPSRDWARLARFVERGGKLIVEGATGYFDEHQVCVMQTGFPLADLLGGSISEFKALGERFEIILDEGGRVTSSSAVLAPEETLVTLWQ